MTTHRSRQIPEDRRDGYRRCSLHKDLSIVTNLLPSLFRLLIPVFNCKLYNVPSRSFHGTLISLITDENKTNDGFVITA